MLVARINPFKRRPLPSWKRTFINNKRQATAFLMSFNTIRT
ncbi:hypothetical protein BSPLISOX_2860 [uncultured Gammaproteobacteria bacterium]|nr:hypothetical protein [uncultured Gammaproteobacteria bacterium]VVH64797.1 hypothetical protein BSPLISOX_2860 [uncultured Gammaproteobacteria bacterium]